MGQRTFSGYGGIRLTAKTYGQSDAPPVLLLREDASDDWTGIAVALAGAGRYVVSLDLRGQGESEDPGDGPFDLDAHVGDLGSILAQLSSRPVVIGQGSACWIALVALGENGPDIASGAVFVDPPHLPRGAPASVDAALADDRCDTPLGERLTDSARRLSLPGLVVAGGGASSPLAEMLADAELAHVRSAGELLADAGEDLNAVLVEFLERRVPREPPEYHAGSDSRTLRDALGTFATGVTVVTTLGAEGEPVGLTANSFTSVSLDPELLLVCLAKTASSLVAFEQAPFFAVNVLHIGQQLVSNRFAMKMDDRFAETDWERWDSGVPIIRNSLASFECARHEMHDAGDHVLLIGRVERVRFEPRRDPLLYFRGKYRRLHFA
ncbi:alpha/beta fold hydrolase [Pacificimonas flava]|uniref:Flavin reductase like domain-containing protein n=1 Tax=Pacificimonas flava TaxID=1234595 RepID=M2TQX3_9SPHN|nr:alpha/beta fold hydrolase [Pacificimonas flava]EMD84196.1 hypothetical protein C725_0126 [Pacificimonas flava]MBB5279926.1 flavin reductase (DIM6/NTAB) family NADH-FMN oxidoreductase RutF [Pacificimonas flava]